MYFSWQCKKSTERGISYFLYTSKESNICVSIQRKIAAYIIFLVLFVTLQEVHRPPTTISKQSPDVSPVKNFFTGLTFFPQSCYIRIVRQNGEGTEPSRRAEAGS